MSTMFLKLNKDWNENFMLYAAFAIIVSTCLGGLTVYFVSMNGNPNTQFIQTLLVVIPCTSVLATILTVQKPKLVLKTLLISMVICLLISLLNLFVF